MHLEAENGRAGSWIVVSGTARIMRDGETFLLTETETCILSATSYQLENAGSLALHIIEVRAWNASG